VAILVRSRSHLQEITKSLRTAGLRFQAEEIDPLCERPVIQDLLALTRALLHPADRVAWLALLRAPWCGLRLADLYALCADAPQATVWDLLQANPQQGELFGVQSNMITKRLGKVCDVLRRALDQKGRLPLRQLVESTWLSLDGPACGDDSALQDAGRFFELLDELDEGGDLASFAELEEQLDQLYAAADPLAGPDLQIMTIHKAKGLEFDTVILPGLGRNVPGEQRSLLRWLEHPEFELLLAPLPASSSDEGDRTYAAIGALLKERAKHEALRLFYVAATRARRQLHLLGHVQSGSREEIAPVAGTLLGSVWPLLAASMIAVHPETTAEESLQQAASLLRSLPEDWRSPPPVPSVGHGIAPAKSASDSGQLTPTAFRPSLRSEEGRIIGSLVHHYLECIGRDGLAAWPLPRITLLREELAARLTSAGIPAHRRAAALQKVETALHGTLSSEQGRWLLKAHADAACEWSLSGVVNGERVHATIDRTFIANGERWIVDYKNSAPASSETRDAFLLREVELYRPQMQTYAQLLTALEPARPLRCALYFPLLDLWQEVDV
jgi:ATP-dependent exoDNAse (exonuclease V) beta subunit